MALIHAMLLVAIPVVLRPWTDWKSMLASQSVDNALWVVNTISYRFLLFGAALAVHNIPLRSEELRPVLLLLTVVILVLFALGRALRNLKSWTWLLSLVLLFVGGAILLKILVKDPGVLIAAAGSLCLFSSLGLSDRRIMDVLLPGPTEIPADSGRNPERTLQSVLDV